MNHQRNVHSAKLADLGMFQFSLKGQEKQRIKEIDTKLAGLALQKIALEKDHQTKLRELLASKNQEIEALSYRAAAEIPLPEVPPVVEKMKANFSYNEIQAEGKSLQQIESEKMKSRIVLELYNQNKELTCTDIYNAIPEFSQYNPMNIVPLVRDLYLDGKIEKEEKRGKAYFYLSEQARTAYSFDNVFDFLVQCDKKEIEALLPHSSAKKTAPWKLRAIIIDALTGSVSGMTIRELHENVPALRDYSNQFISGLVRDLTNNGYVVRIVKNGKTYFKLA